MILDGFGEILQKMVTFYYEKDEAKKVLNNKLTSVLKCVVEFGASIQLLAR